MNIPSTVFEQQSDTSLPACEGARSLLHPVLLSSLKGKRRYKFRGIKGKAHSTSARVDVAKSDIHLATSFACSMSKHIQHGQQ